MVLWDDEHPDGCVPGYQYQYDTAVAQKGLIPLQNGDVIEFLYDCYAEADGEYQGVYTYGDPLTVDGELMVSYEDIGLGDCYVYYMLTDIYQNVYWTEPVQFYDT